MATSISNSNDINENIIEMPNEDQSNEISRDL